MKYKSILIALCATGILFGIGLLTYVYHAQPVINKAFPSPKFTQAPSVSKISGQPDKLLIPSLNMDLNVIPGYYDPLDHDWNLTLTDVQYAVITPKPNNKEGATLLYGHYRPEVFAYLHMIAAGAQAVVMTTNHHAFYYQLASIMTTSPLNDSVFNYRGAPVLMIQTCAGPLFQYRQFYTFNLVKVT